MTDIHTLLSLLAELGCSDGYCCLKGPAKGMHTNSHCHCLDEIRNPLLRARLRTFLFESRKLIEGLTFGMN